MLPSSYKTEYLDLFLVTYTEVSGLHQLWNQGKIGLTSAF